MRKFLLAPLAILLALSPTGAFADPKEVALRDEIPADPSFKPAVDEATRPDYVLGTGDKVRILVYGEDDLGGTFQIDAKGYVQLPLVGSVLAAGGTSDDLGARYASALSDGYVLSPRVNVEVLQYRPFYVIGEVAKPGQYDYVNDMSVPNAIALAGGYTVKAVNSWIYVRHAGEKAERRVAADETTKIAPGDVLRVPNTAFWTVMDVISPLTGVATTMYYPRPF
ncbi:MAG: polysaccharide export protein [Alphaproteobacteria bacterium]|nr:polysaccharide export protein [Alphaproteobacteria bacterium]